MKTVRAFALALTLLPLGCMASTTGGGDPQEDTAQTDDELINTGGGGLDYSCTTTIEGTTCACDEGAGPKDALSCLGMKKYCHDHGATVGCFYPPKGGSVCTCSFTSAPSSGTSSSGGLGVKGTVFGP